MTGDRHHTGAKHNIKVVENLGGVLIARTRWTQCGSTYLLFDKLCQGIASHNLLILCIIPYLFDQEWHDLRLHLDITLEDVHGVEKHVTKLIWVSFAQ